MHSVAFLLFSHAAAGPCRNTCIFLHSTHNRVNSVAVTFRDISSNGIGQVWWIQCTITIFSIVLLSCHGGRWANSHTLRTTQHHGSVFGHVSIYTFHVLSELAQAAAGRATCINFHAICHQQSHLLYITTVVAQK